MENKRLEEIIRVDHAGEHGATSIYKGTIDVLNILGDEKTKKIISEICLLYTSPSPRDKRQSRMPSSA